MSRRRSVRPVHSRPVGYRTARVLAEAGGTESPPFYPPFRTETPHKDGITPNLKGGSLRLKRRADLGADAMLDPTSIGGGASSCGVGRTDEQLLTHSFPHAIRGPLLQRLDVDIARCASASRYACSKSVARSRSMPCVSPFIP